MLGHLDSVRAGGRIWELGYSAESADALVMIYTVPVYVPGWTTQVWATAELVVDSCLSMSIIVCLRRGSSSSSNSRMGKTILLFTNNQDPVKAAGGNAAHLRYDTVKLAYKIT